MLEHFLLCCVLAVFDAVTQAPHDGKINLLFANLVFDTVVDTWVVIHFNHDRVTVDFLEVHTVKAVADKACNAERRFHDTVGDAFNRQAIPLAADLVLVLAIQLYICQWSFAM